MGYYDQTNENQNLTSDSPQSTQNIFNITESEKIVVAQGQSRVVSAKNFFQNFIYTIDRKPASWKLISLIIFEYILFIAIPYHVVATYLAALMGNRDNEGYDIITSYLTSELSKSHDYIDAIIRIGFFIMSTLLITFLTFRTGVRLYSLWVSFMWGMYTVLFLTFVLKFPDVISFPIGIAVYVCSIYLHFLVFGVQQIIEVKSKSKLPFDNKTYSG